MDMLFISNAVKQENMHVLKINTWLYKYVIESEKIVLSCKKCFCYLWKTLKILITMLL